MPIAGIRSKIDELTQYTFSKNCSSIPLYFFLLMICLGLGFDFSFICKSVYDQKRMIQFAIFVLLVLVFLFDRKQVGGICSAWSTLPPITRSALKLVIVLGAVSCFLSPLPKYAFQEWSLFGLLFLLMLYLSDRLVSFSAQKIVLLTLAVAFSIYAWRFLAGAYFPEMTIDIKMENRELFVGFIHPRFLNQLQSWLLPLLAVFVIVFRYVQNSYRWLLWIPGMTGWMLLFLSNGRGTLIAMVFSSVVVLILFGQKAFKWFKIHATLAILGFLFYIFLFYILPYILSIKIDMLNMADRLANEGLNSRDLLWSMALDLALANPIFGFGPQQFALVDNQALAAHPHSAPIQWISEWGMISFCLVFGIVIYGFIKWIKFVKNRLNEPSTAQSALLVGLTASLTAGATHSLVSGVIVMPFSQLLLCVILGWVLSIYNTVKNPNSTIFKPEIFQKAGLTIAALVFLFTLFYTSFPDIVQTDQASEKFLIQYPNKTVINPRFWKQGLIGVKNTQP